MRVMTGELNLYEKEILDLQKYLKEQSTKIIAF